MKKAFVIALATLAGIAAGVARAGPLVDGDPAAGKQKSQTCAACHGATGNAANPQYPKLAGQGAPYLLKQLKDFKSGARENAIMTGQVASLSVQDMKDLAVFYSNQEVEIGSADQALVDAGRRLYRGGDPAEGVSACTGCHGPAGKGNPAAGFPMLSGQHTEYVATQLKAFKSGQRANDPGKMMRNIASEMSSGQIEAVSSYVEGLHPGRSD